MIEKNVNAHGTHLYMYLYNRVCLSSDRNEHFNGSGDQPYIKEEPEDDDEGVPGAMYYEYAKKLLFSIGFIAYG